MQWTSPVARGPAAEGQSGAARRRWWRSAASGAAAAGLLCAALLVIGPHSQGSQLHGVGVVRRVPRVVLLDGVNDAEWSVNQAFTTFSTQDDEEHPAVQQAMEFSGVCVQERERYECLCLFVSVSVFLCFCVVCECVVSVCLRVPRF